MNQRRVDVVAQAITRAVWRRDWTPDSVARAALEAADRVDAERPTTWPDLKVHTALMPHEMNAACELRPGEILRGQDGAVIAERPSIGHPDAKQDWREAVDSLERVFAFHQRDGKTETPDEEAERIMNVIVRRAVEEVRNQFATDPPRAVLAAIAHEMFTDEGER